MNWDRMYALANGNFFFLALNQSYTTATHANICITHVVHAMSPRLLLSIRTNTRVSNPDYITHLQPRTEYTHKHLHNKVLVEDGS